jgi:deoxyribose-phosphate aldolase
VELEHLVEKITREVMESVKSSPSTNSGNETVKHNTCLTGQKNQVSVGITLLTGSPGIDPELLKSSISHLESGNSKVTQVLIPAGINFHRDGVRTIRCGSSSDALEVVKSAETIVILLCDTASVSRLANLDADRFDVEAVLSALESGKEVRALKVGKSLPKPLQQKVDGFLREIESFGIKIEKLECDRRETRTDSSSPVDSSCLAASGPECAGCGHCANLNTNQVKNIVDKGAERVSAAPGMSIVPSEIAGMIDHTLLKPDATREQVLSLCQEARKYSFASCCVNPTWVRTVAECLKGSPVKTCVVIGFPLGANSTVIKEMETRDAIAAGADEIDMVINVGALKAGDYNLVKRDIEAVVNAAQGKIVKVILETALLNDEEKVRGCELSKEAGADFVKTSTGFGPGGATAKDIALMRKTVGKYMGVKASGGIRDFETAREMIEAGATRIGASASVGIVKGASAPKGSGY